MKKPQPGRCQFCRCTDDHACDLGFDTCAWANRDYTVCSNPKCLQKAKAARIPLRREYR